MDIYHTAKLLTIEDSTTYQAKLFYLGYSQLDRLKYDVDFDVNIQKSTYGCKKIMNW